MNKKRKLAVNQSNYIPWKGYFDLINSVDEFVIYDDMQYTKNDWRNRNKIKTLNGVIWLTIPVKQYKLSQRIDETEVAKDNWAKKHWFTIIFAYSKAKYFNHYRKTFEELYLNITTDNLSEINYIFLRKICEILSIKTKLSWSKDYKLSGDKSERLVQLCEKLNIDHYISGPAAKVYLDLESFHKKNINVEFYDYSNYPEYNQLYGAFTNEVSILDLIFNEGENAVKYMKSFKTIES